MSKKKKVTSFTDADFVVKPAEEPVEPTESAEPTENPNPPAVQDNFVIQEVEVPGRKSRKGTLSYPIGSLTPGSNQSFYVVATEATLKSVAASIRTFGYRNGFKVILRPEGNGIRVWRKAEVTEAAQSA